MQTQSINRCLSLVFLVFLMLIGLAAAVIFSPGAAAQEYDFGGYFKTLFIGGRTFFEENYFLVLHRLRTELSFKPARSTELYAALDNQLRWGSYLDTVEYSYARPLDDRYYIDMAVDPLDNRNAHWRAEFYRLYFRAVSRSADITIGRQRIAWGTGRLWNPTDLFNPTSPLQIEPGEKRGTDALFLALRPADRLNIDIAAAVGADRDDTRLGARVRSAVGYYDVSAMAGRFRDSNVAGFDFSGYIGDAGFRGEFTHTWNPGDKRFWRCVLGFENGFRNGLILLAEYLYNGGNIGEITPEVIEDLASFDAITTLNSHFLALQLSKELTPLAYGSLLSLVDLEDGGLFLFPSLSYSWKQDVDLTFGAQIFLADKGDFSLAHNTIVFGLEWYF
jgi:hypothetical protein